LKLTLTERPVVGMPEGDWVSMVSEAEPLTCVREYPYSTGGLLEKQGNAMPELALVF
jgi:hypothetical protein